MKTLFLHSESYLMSTSILLSNVYESCGNMKIASDIHIQVAKSGAKVRTGVSITEINENIFVSLEIFFKLKYCYFYFIIVGILSS